MVLGFCAGGVPELIFGRGAFESLPERIQPFGNRVLLIGDAYLRDHPSLLKDVADRLLVKGISMVHVSALAKTTQGASEKILSANDLGEFDCVVAIGAGRAMDTGKLVSKHLPYIAVPTTAGTGAPMNEIIFGGETADQETSKRAHLARIVIADPAFIDEMDRDDFATRALSVFMLLMESYVSPKASILSDALVWSGLESFARGFIAGVEGDITGRDAVFYASLMAGVGTGQAGFGLTHRLGALIEQKAKLTYAQSCSSISAEVTDLQIQMLSDFLPDHDAMDKYAMIGELIASRPFEDREEAYASLVGTLRRWVARLEVPKLALKDKQLEGICDHVLKDWDEEVLPIMIDQDDIFASLLRRAQNV